MIQYSPPSAVPELMIIYNMYINPNVAMRLPDWSISGNKLAPTVHMIKMTNNMAILIMEIMHRRLLPLSLEAAEL